MARKQTKNEKEETKKDVKTESVVEEVTIPDKKDPGKAVETDEADKEVEKKEERHHSEPIGFELEDFLAVSLSTGFTTLGRGQKILRAHYPKHIYEQLEAAAKEKGIYKPIYSKED